ncbi:TetR/AcrR family transcriptional regulator [Pontibacter sp. G13]|uniref:TetR/AcrR family transcriptional regulator n=1 Tax=Pontibacter sp. G13 TaxID=3074898 RepID=UPI00288A5448|nr:TetR/AcrR family transcriptional regulator [Pontibacter sp. G13]WNJ18375.1 TetR/AcrR family transcriptional regulator [Pontibacter sp. G13]
MGRKKHHSRTSILEAAVELVDLQGKEHFAVRNLAKHIGASTQPIYSYFPDFKSLYDAVLEEIGKLHMAYINKPYSEYVFRNMGFGFTLFAKDHPNLFQAFFDDHDRNRTFIEGFLKGLRIALDNDERFDLMSSRGKDVLLDKMWTFCYGYASLIIKKLVLEDSDEQIKDRILETGRAIILDTLKREGIID